MVLQGMVKAKEILAVDMNEKHEGDNQRERRRYIYEDIWKEIEIDRERILNVYFNTCFFLWELNKK